MSISALGTRSAVVLEAVAHLADAAIEPQELLHEVARRVRGVVPYDRGSWGLTDGETLLESDAVVVEPFVDCWLTHDSALGELSADAVNRFVDLDEGARVVATLTRATRGRPETTARHRDVLAPRGLHDELRLLARSADVTWATASLARASDVPPFSEDEERFLAAIAAHVGRGLRRGLARGPLTGANGAAGMLVLDADGAVVSSTGRARDWLARLPTPHADGAYLPPAVELVALHARAAGSGGDGRPSRVRVLIPGDGWVVVQAERLDGVPGEPPRTAVIISPADGATLQPVLLAVFGFTRRERAVAELLLQGRSVEEIAVRLSLSRHTVRDHLKAIFAKAGVSSRAALTARLAAA